MYPHKILQVDDMIYLFFMQVCLFDDTDVSLYNILYANIPDAKLLKTIKVVIKNKKRQYTAIFLLLKSKKTDL